MYFTDKETFSSRPQIFRRNFVGWEVPSVGWIEVTSNSAENLSECAEMHFENAEKIGNFHIDCPIWLIGKKM